jgi:hypothetical protein
MEAILHRVFSAIGKAHVGLRARGDSGGGSVERFFDYVPKVTRAAGDEPNSAAAPVSRLD